MMNGALGNRNERILCFYCNAECKYQWTFQRPYPYDPNNYVDVWQLWKCQGCSHVYHILIDEAKHIGQEK